MAKQYIATDKVRAFKEGDTLKIEVTARPGEFRSINLSEFNAWVIRKYRENIFQPQPQGHKK